MVIILHQNSLEGDHDGVGVVGRRRPSSSSYQQDRNFISTMNHDDDEGENENDNQVHHRPSNSNSASSSITSQHSISERSAIYKQRIDSLFQSGRNKGTVSSKASTAFTDSLKVENLHQQQHNVSSVTIVQPDKNNNSNSSIMWRNTGSSLSSSYSCSPEITSSSLKRGSSSPLQFSVEYLGSVPVDGGTTSLQDLQKPLKSLYIKFLSHRGIMRGHISITAEGVRFEAPKLRLVNPFSTIAVWAAIKFVAKKGEDGQQFSAFMPLISDPEGQDKNRLFAPMDLELIRHYPTSTFKNPPLFACVMKEASFSLNCHAFACRCAEDAIVVAANLYQSLVDKMRRNNSSSKEGESGYGSLNPLNSPVKEKESPPRSSSVTEPLSSSSGDEPNSKSRNSVAFSDPESVIPIRPARRKNKTPTPVMNGNLKRHGSEDSVLFKRRRSFKQQKQLKRVKISTPKIMKQDEIMTTSSSSTSSASNDPVDQILDRIINPGGMSFNDLKPSYQELILKIALTLTQDQLYKKSKQAMKKQQLYLGRKKVLLENQQKDPSSLFLLHNLLKKPFSSSKGNKGGGGILLRPHAPPPPPEALPSFCSGCVCESCSEKCYCSLPSKDKDKALLLNKNKPKKLCGYDSESCAESEKCYCSLQRVKSNGLKIYNINLDTDETSDTDTNSYDLQEKERERKKEVEDGSPPGSSSSSNGKTVSARSVEILSYQRPLGMTYSFQQQKTNAIVHFEDEKEDEDKVLLITGNETPASRLASRQLILDGKMRRNRANSTSPSSSSSSEQENAEKMLSMKKTAEIAAMFTNLKLDQTTNLVVTPDPDLPSSLENHSDNSNNSYLPSHSTSNNNHSDFEASLGYLP